MAAKNTPSKRSLVFQRDGHKCLHCGTGKNLTIDHVIPKSRGGSGHISNLQTLCKRCNGTKGNQPPEGLEHLPIVVSAKQKNLMRAQHRRVTNKQMSAPVWVPGIADRYYG